FHFFFFQAEDGIRDFHVTGVQTCALPILDRAVAEESLVAEYARIGTDAGRAPARVALWAAASMRTYGQEEPWQPGSGGPTVAEQIGRASCRERVYVAEVGVTIDGETNYMW